MPLRDITPERYKCGFDASCPGVFEDADGCHILIRGKRSTDDCLRPGPGEVAVRIPIGLLDNVGGPLSRWCKRWGL